MLNEVLDCPLITKSYILSEMILQDDHFDLNNEQEEQQDLLSFLKKEDHTLFEKFKHFILPGVQRLNLIEWLLETFESGILQSPELQGINDLLQVDKIEIILKELGITNHYLPEVKNGKVVINNSGSSQNSLQKSIEGLNGTSDSIQLLYRLCNFVVTSKQIAQNGTPQQFTAYSDKLLNYISINRNEIFKEQVRLFPPGFPKTDENFTFESIDQLQEIVEDLTIKVADIQRKTQDLNADVFMKNQDQIKLVTDDDLSILKKSLADLKNQILNFNQEFENSLKRDLTKVAQQEIQSELGKQVEKCFEEKTKFQRSTNEFQYLLESLGKISAQLQLAGLDPDKNYSQEGQINNEQILDLISQLKSIKLSMASKAKFGPLY